ncbi:MAG TPA: DNA polymerase III subunit gamma/tau [Acidimicrobiia bacterium]|nr:DNA polymerase III subunit gamma/tau [Acidimicrobiia bacterium]
MQYQALYRKYRPQTFDDVIGQAHVTTTLAREVADEKVAHAYLFSGPRGTGKTTTARILAKALNCENRNADGSPCSACSSCVSIAEGNSLDVMELDAASHNSVDDIRDIKLSVTTVASAATSKRVFVLDEAHMLSKAAGNALLQTLEEPPEHVHFVLATTEPYKLLDTIRSRTQRFDFHPVPVEELAGYLSTIADRESYKTDPSALIAIARHAGGSVRDSLSLLEQVAALGSGTADVTGVRRALGLADSEAFQRLAEAVANQDAKAALELVAEQAASGVDLRRFVAECIAFFRGVFLAHYAPNLAEIADEPPEVYESWRKAAEIVPSADVLRAVDLLAEALVRLREGREERLMAELAVIKLTRPETATDSEALISRMDRLERRMGKLGEDGPQPKSSQLQPQPNSEFPSEKPETSPATPAPDLSADEDLVRAAAPLVSDEGGDEADDDLTPIDVSFEQLQKVWPGLFGGLRDLLGARRWAFFREAVPAAVERNTIVLEVAHDFHLSSLEQDDAVAPIVAAKASDLLGGSVKVKFRLKSEGGEGSEDDDVDLTDLEERPAADTDPASLLESELGAKVVDD